MASKAKAKTATEQDALYKGLIHVKLDWKEDPEASDRQEVCFQAVQEDVTISVFYEHKSMTTRIFLYQDGESIGNFKYNADTHLYDTIESHIGTRKQTRLSDFIQTLGK